MLRYFLYKVAGDGQSSSNFKAISSTDSKALRLYQRGYVQKVEVTASGNVVFYKARCEPEMRTKKHYKLRLSVETVGGDGHHSKSAKDVLFAECSCPAGKAPFASCKHLAAVLFALEDVSRNGFTRGMITCTDELQTWNRPHTKKSKPVILSEMVWTKSRLRSVKD